MDQPIQGGISSGDIPIRTCVYPSYGLNVPSNNRPGVLLASYTWSQDAQRMGGLAHSSAVAELKDLTLRNLIKLHGLPENAFPLETVQHFALNWQNDVNARGAFAGFTPGQFGDASFASMKMPAAQNKLHFAGEATSVHHAWVLGALNSAWRAVYSALGNIPNGEQHRINLGLIWGTPDEEKVDSLLQLAALAEEQQVERYALYQ